MSPKPFIIVLAFILLLVLLINKAPKTSENTLPEGTNSAWASSCINAGGNYLAEFNECEFIGADQCTALSGSFNECASACRHDPSAEFCTLQCVQVCKFE